MEISDSLKYKETLGEKVKKKKKRTQLQAAANPYRIFSPPSHHLQYCLIRIYSAVPPAPPPAFLLLATKFTATGWVSRWWMCNVLTTGFRIDKRPVSDCQLVNNFLLLFRAENLCIGWTVGKKKKKAKCWKPKKNFTMGRSWRHN